MSQCLTLERLGPMLSSLSFEMGLFLKISVLFAGALLVGYGLRDANPRWRRLLWRGVALATLALPPLLVFAPRVNIPVFTAPPAASSETAIQPEEPENEHPSQATRGVEELVELSTHRGLGLREEYLIGAANGASPQGALENADSPSDPVAGSRSGAAESYGAPAPDATGGSPWGARGALGMVWLAGVMTYLARLLPASALLRRLVRTSSPATAALARQYGRVARDLGITAPPRLAVSDRIAAPMVTGLRRPWLLVPPYLEARPAWEQRACLAHELGHHVGADVRWSFLVYAVASGLWFHPLAWLARRAHETACEEVADGVAADLVGDRRAYASCLARVGLEANRRRDSQLALAAYGGLSMARLSAISRRLRRLARHDSAGPLARRHAAAFGIVGVVAVLALASLGASAANPAGSGAAAVAPPPVAAAAPTDWTGDLTAIAPTDWNYDRAAHLLERAGFGGTPEEIDRLARMTPAEAVDFLVDYESIPAGAVAPFDESGIYPNGHKVRPLQEIVATALLSGKAFGIKATQEGKLAYQPAVNEFYTLLVSEHAEMHRAGAWWAERMLTTPRPLEEKLTLFWHDHFATSQEKVLRYQKMIGQIETLRKNASGNFRDLLIAVAQDPAMLVWLDNKDNVKGKPNENFAREVMELFSMGEGQGYSEHDIREMARAFTGWTMTPDNITKHEGKFANNPELHDPGVKTFLGASGEFNGHDAIDIILKQPATGRFIAKKFYRYFVRDDIESAPIDPLAKVLVDSGYEFKPFLKTVFLSRDFYAPVSIGTRIKGPVEFIVSTSKKFGLDTIPSIPDFTETCETLGQVLFFPPNVAGWPDGRSWINPSTLLTRGNYVHALLVPEPETYGAPDKVVDEGYRRIPLAFPEYAITPRIWNAKTGKMEPVSPAEYEEFLAGIGSVTMEEDRLAKVASGAGPAMPADNGSMPKSKMSKIANDEKYNLAVGVYTGFVTAFDRVKAIPRVPAAIDLAGMAKKAGVQSPREAVDYFSRRFLSVPLPQSDREAIVAFLEKQILSDRLDYSSPALERALRQAVHLILSSPEYQLG